MKASLCPNELGMIYHQYPQSLTLFLIIFFLDTEETNEF